MEGWIFRERLPPDLQTRRTLPFREPFRACTPFSSSRPRKPAIRDLAIPPICGPVSVVAMRTAAVMALRFGWRGAAAANPVCDFADAGGLPT